MPQARTQEERDITRRCKAWAFKLAHEDVYVIFDKLPRRTLAMIWPGMCRIKSHGMRTFQRNPVVFDLDKIKNSGDSVEDVIIHECMHLVVRDEKNPHNGAFHAAMKQQLGRYEWEEKPRPLPSMTSAGTATLSLDGVPVAECKDIQLNFKKE